MINLSPYLETVRNSEPLRVYGRVNEITGLLIKGMGLKVRVGESCRIYNETGSHLEAEVVGFQNGKTLLMSSQELSGIRPGARIYPRGENVATIVGPELIGRVINEEGKPLDGKGMIRGKAYPLFASPPNPLHRPRISQPLDLGIRAINGLITCGKGQRVGIMAGSGVGKSVLMGMIARYTEAEVNVIALIGERGREVREFLEKDLGEQGLARSVVVVSTSDQSPLAKVRAAFVATAVAEYFRDQGRDVLLLMDSLTRVAMAQREVGLAIGEPPTTKGYTPSVFALLPKLLERAGTAPGQGSITGLYTVLVEGDDLTEPVTDTARSILDGHIVLSRDLAMENHYPAIDVLRSISRVMPDIVDAKHKEHAGKFVETLARYHKQEDMINLGMYKQGANPAVDYAIAMNEKLKAYLRQGMNDKRDFSDCLQGLYCLFD
ncbi:MAG TPA: FliI/YscN family ATPase [Thermodesulfobacteriota bacterium]|nr:FliI/YscN family ATPase [Thermodesulfobacteriota bacterium]